ncbi:GT4 family glycosyltransferase PelF [Actinacidiphila paucisporea]|uniref:D-inositol 3-phosphate glycosyltransferase n=1 Tax=Actinacidiphila paucisporea TaxID=310782 RepID=A0A1M7AA42_9ACTN|nr:GT4 family glycosyltransferase PelF [Actinacidiphila paucisporea]SHL39587.1 Glycosyltransferase involved in cell wall bisynthesis [Actinacidiphila paucisporea]
MHAVFGDPPSRIAQVTLLTEGTYPHAPGGVSVWCDQLVRALPDVDFRVTALTATGLEQPVWELPPQVRALEAVPMWGGTPDGRKPRGRDRRAFLGAWERLLTALLAEGSGADELFGPALYELAGWADAGVLPAGLRSEAAVRTLVGLWRRPGTDVAAARPTQHDALTGTDLLEHALRPLAATAPTGVAHAVSGGLATLPGLLAHHREEVPLLLTEHGVYQRERYLGSRTGPHRWPVKSLILHFFRLLAREGYRHSALITPGNRYNRRWEEHGGADADRIRTVYNGVDPGAFPPAGPEPEVPTLSWAGRIDPIKDLETLIRAFALVREEIPAARLRIFGGTPRGGEEYRARCEALAATVGAADAVRFEGRVDDIRTAYAAGQVVMLSSISEGFPFTLIEAMSCGRCTVSTDVGGVREAVGDTGLVVPPRDPAAMAAATVALLRDPARRASLGEAARLRVIDQFTLRQTIDAFRTIYTDLSPSEPRTAQQYGGVTWTSRVWRPTPTEGTA